jgi:hypothetical protein
LLSQLNTHSFWDTLSLRSWNSCPILTRKLGSWHRFSSAIIAAISGPFPLRSSERITFMGYPIKAFTHSSDFRRGMRQIFCRWAKRHGKQTQSLRRTALRKSPKWVKAGLFPLERFAATVQNAIMNMPALCLSTGAMREKINLPRRRSAPVITHMHRTHQRIRCNRSLSQKIPT